MKDKVFLLLRQILEGDINGNTNRLRRGNIKKRTGHPPARDRPLVDTLIGIGDKPALVDLLHNAGAAAFGAGSQRIEGKILGGKGDELHAALRTYAPSQPRRIKRGGKPVPVRAKMRTKPRKRKTQNIEKLAHRSQRAPDTGNYWTLTQRHGTRQITNTLHVGTRRLPDTAARVRRQRLQIPPRPLRVKYIRRERALSRTGDAADRYKAVQRDIHVNIL